MMAMAIATAVSTGVGAMAAHSQGMTEAARRDGEAQLADTNALQRDTSSRDELTRFLSSTQSARSANGLSALSPNAMKLMSEATKVSSQERLVQTADSKQRASNMRVAAKSSRRGARFSLVGGLVKAAVPLGEYYSYQNS